MNQTRSSILLRTTIPAALALLVGCGSDRISGGGATETGNGIACRILTDSGKIVADARVVFVRTDSWFADVERDGAPTTIHAVADAEGIVRLEEGLEGKWAIQADRSDRSGWKPLLGTLQGTDTLRISPKSMIRGRITGDTVTRILVPGTDWSAKVEGQGGFLLMKASGSFALVGLSQRELVPLGTGMAPEGGSIDLDLVAKRRFVLLDDFADGDQKTSLFPFTGIGNWYLTKLGGARMYSSSDTSRPDFRGALSMLYSMDASSGYLAAGISFVDGSGYHKLDLSRLDSFCFEARGNGKLTVYFQQILRADWVEGSGKVLVGNLQETWQTSCLKPSDFGSAWDALRLSTTDISFAPREGNHMELRRIEFRGPTLRDLSVR